MTTSLQTAGLKLHKKDTTRKRIFRSSSGGLVLYRNRQRIGAANSSDLQKILPERMCQHWGNVPFCLICGVTPHFGRAGNTRPCGFLPIAVVGADIIRPPHKKFPQKATAFWRNDVTAPWTGSPSNGRTWGFPTSKGTPLEVTFCSLLHALAALAHWQAEKSFSSRTCR